MDMEARELSREDDLGSHGSEMEIDKEGINDDFLDKRSRESRKHMSKDGKDRRSKDRERSKEREKDGSSRRHSARHDTRERDKERRKESNDKDRELDWDRHRDKERSRDKAREKEKDRGKDYDRDREPDVEREHERGGGRKGREHEKDRDAHKERDSAWDKATEHASDRVKDRERGQDRDKRHDKSKDREKDYENQIEREMVKDKDRERGKDREREREKNRDKAKDRGREKEKVKDRGREGKENVREKDRSEKAKVSWETNNDKSRTRVKERDISRGKGGEEDDRAKVGGDTKAVGNKAKEAEAESFGLNGSSEKPVGSQPSSELEERLLKIKQERLKRKADDSSEISSWVSKSRKLEDNRIMEREKAARTSRILDEQDNVEEESDDETATGHSRKDLAGVKILHGLNKVIEGGAVVLTLKDQSILVDGDINEEADMLENVEIGEQRRRDDAYKAAKKKTGYEDEFNDNMGPRKTILPQYDDPIEDEGVTLDESGRFTGEAEKKLEELRKRIEGGSTIRAFEDLNSTSKNTSDYYTPDEMLQFKKPKKKKSLRKREKLDLDALEAEAISAGLGVGDLGSRKNSKGLSAMDEKDKAEAEMRSNAYQTALAKAEEASKVLRQEQTLTVKTMDDDDMVFGEDYEDLERSLEQARKLALKRKEEDAPSGPQAVAILATANKKEEDNQSSTDVESQENKVVITEMEEFVLGLQLNEETHKAEADDVFKDEDDIPKPVDHEMEDVDGGWTEIKETNLSEEPVSEEKVDIAPNEIIHEVAVGKGLSGALKLLKDRGTLKESIDWGGRNMDKKKSKLVGINDNEGPKEIRIERTDEFGRIMTPKEAFRMISHKFHGKEPGKMKQEKRMKQFREDLKAKQMKSSDTPLLAMEKMREAQAKLKSPYIVLSGHVKPGQSSDPRSGFATLEKYHPGSLTPMLGDKKVEHFLGINRKSDSGSMGPPPPKKPKN